jgi:hypothetical protein
MFCSIRETLKKCYYQSVDLHFFFNYLAPNHLLCSGGRWKQLLHIIRFPIAYWISQIYAFTPNLVSITAEVERRDNSPFRYFIGELYSGNSLRSTIAVGNDKKRQRVYNTMFHVPWRCERVYILHLKICSLLCVLYIRIFGILGLSYLLEF